VHHYSPSKTYRLDFDAVTPPITWGLYGTDDDGQLYLVYAEEVGPWDTLTEHVLMAAKQLLLDLKSSGWQTR
jgi:hypothetical protein